MKLQNKVLLTIIALVGLTALANSVYIVEPDQVALVKQLGEISTVVVRKEKEELVRQGLSKYDTLGNVCTISNRESCCLQDESRFYY